MPLKLNGEWRFEAPADTDFVRSQIPGPAVEDFVEMVDTLSLQGDQWNILELFKRHFSRASGTTHLRSSALFFAEQDLRRDADAAAKNAPLFIEAFFDACRSFEGESDGRYAPDETRINAVLVKHSIGFEIRGDQLILRGEAQALIPVAIAAPTLAEQSVELIQASLNSAEELLYIGFFLQEHERMVNNK